MEITLSRQSYHKNFTKGIMVVNGKPYYTIEDKCREVTGEPVTKWKVAGATAIPRGRYEVVITMSHRFGKWLPELLKVPGFTGIRIHEGNVDADTSGCILPGMVSVLNGVGQSRKAMAEIQPAIQQSLVNGEKVWITIK